MGHNRFAERKTVGIATRDADSSSKKICCARSADIPDLVRNLAEEIASSVTQVLRLAVDVIRNNRSKQRLQVHEFVFMREHIHMILTPAPQVSLEKAMQFVKGGFSYRLKKEMGFKGEVWQKGNENRIRDPEHYAQAVEYVRMNPVKAGLAEKPEEYPYSSARLRNEVDPAPEHLRFKSRA